MSPVDRRLASHAEAKQHASTLLKVSELERSKEDMIEEYMESPEFYTFLDEHDDDVIHVGFCACISSEKMRKNGKITKPTA